MALQRAPEFQYHCPCCNAEYVTFGEVNVGELLNKDAMEQASHMARGITPAGRREAVGTCRNPKCRQMVVFRLRASVNINDRGVVYFGGNSWHVDSTAPAPRRAMASELLPPAVRQCMLEAEQTLIARDVAPRIARGAFRTALDVATKDIVTKNPACLGGKNPEKITLFERINLLAAAKLLSPELQAWAHGVRGITNEDVHTVEPVSKEEAQEIAEITRLILTYLFELPARVKQAKAAAEAKKAERKG